VRTRRPKSEARFAFVAWWQTHVTPGGKGGDRKSKDHGFKNATVIPAADATAQTGVSKVQVSRWVSHLKYEVNCAIDRSLHVRSGCVAVTKQALEPATFFVAKKYISGSRATRTHPARDRTYFEGRIDDRRRVQLPKRKLPH
jgi:hypothetical protein